MIFKQKMSELVKEMYDAKLKCVFTSFKVKGYFSLKCRSSKFLVSDVVYKFTCQCDTDMFYLGETDRHIGIRGGEHLDLEKKQVSAVGTHIQNCEGCFEKLENGLLSYNDFEIVKRCQSEFDTEIHEALLIQKCHPSMNIQLPKSGNSVTLKVFS